MGQVRESTADPLTRLSFEFLVLTAARSGEVRMSTWSEIDLESSTWTVPAKRMKARRDHRVPLCRRCLEILAEVRESEPTGQCSHFPGKDRRIPVRRDLLGAIASPGDTRRTPRVSKQLQELVHGGQSY